MFFHSLFLFINLAFIFSTSRVSLSICKYVIIVFALNKAYKNFDQKISTGLLVNFVAGSSKTPSRDSDEFKCSDFKLGWTDTTNVFS